MSTTDAPAVTVRIKRILDGAPRIELTATFPTDEAFDAQLPVWRPGRYQVQNFAQFIYSMQGLVAGEWQALRKTALHRWQVPENTEAVRWVFHANTFNAGSTGVGEDVLYVNPVNCFLYHPDHEDWGYRVVLDDVPADWSVATGLAKDGDAWLARDVQHIMDSPLLAGPELWHANYTSNGVPFHIWIYGKHTPDAERFVREHQDFTDAKSRTSAVSLPRIFTFARPAELEVRHGVEHEDTTVIAQGPSAKSQTEEGHMELIGIASHELYHCWNVKRIRPAEWTPYDFSRPAQAAWGTLLRA